jgi:predicted GNAT superfamily acetyltransferase
MCTVCPILTRRRMSYTCYSITVDPQLATNQQLQCTQLTPKTASVVPPEYGRLTPETCRGLRHNKVIVKVKVY